MVSKIHVEGKDESYIYDESLFTPMINWINQHENQTISERKLDEFKSLTNKIRYDTVKELGKKQIPLWKNIVRPVKRVMMNLQETDTKLDSEMVRSLCSVINGETSSSVLPELNDGYYARHNDLDNPNKLQMMTQNNEDVFMSMTENKTYSEEDIENAPIPEDKEYNLAQYYS